MPDGARQKPFIVQPCSPSKHESARRLTGSWMRRRRTQEATALRRWSLGCTWASWPGGPSSSLRCGLRSLHATLQPLLDALPRNLSGIHHIRALPLPTALTTVQQLGRRQPSFSYDSMLRSLVISLHPLHVTGGSTIPAGILLCHACMAAHIAVVCSCRSRRSSSGRRSPRS